MVTDDVKAYFLEHGRVATIATPRRNAGPNMSPLWFLWDPDEKVFLISTFEGREGQDGTGARMSLLIDGPLNNPACALRYGRGVVIGPARTRWQFALIKYRYSGEASLSWKEINEDGQRVSSG